jgi:hypothetical protein
MVSIESVVTNYMNPKCAVMGGFVIVLIVLGQKEYIPTISIEPCGVVTALAVFALVYWMLGISDRYFGCKK